MADRYCPSCGTEVDADARFCPTCGITLEDGAQPELPAAPSWPEPERPEVPEPLGAAHALEPPGEVEQPPAPKAVHPPVTPPPAPATSSAPRSLEPAQPVPSPPPRVEQGIDLPFTWPTTASGWLIGIGSVLGAIALIPSFVNLLSVLLFLALLGVAATIFLAEWIPPIPRLRLITLVVTTIGLGIGLDRSAFTVRGMDTILLFAMLAAVGGALLVELDRDRPMPPPGSARG
jgi:hypothetical protein